MSFISKLINTGIRANQDEALQRKVRLVNIISLSCGAFSSISALIYLGLQIYLISFFLFGLLFLAALPLLLNAIQKYFLSRLTWILNFNLAVLVMSQFMGAEAYVQFNFIPAMILPLILFSRENIVVLLLLMLLSPVLFFLSHFEHLPSENYIQSIDSNSLVRIIQYFEISSTFLVSALMIFSLRFDAHKAEAALKKALETKQSFMAILFHDLYNPLNVSLMSLDLLIQDEQLKKNKHINKVYKSNTMMNALIQQVRYREQNPDLPVQLQNVKLNQLMQNLYTLFSTSAERKRIQFQINNHIKADSIRSDETILTFVVISNLISNAIKFTGSEGKVELSFFEAEGRTRIEIKDTGEGIEHSHLEKAKNNLNANSEMGTDGERGSGYGLLLVFRALKSIRGQLRRLEPDNHWRSKLQLVLPPPLE